MSPQINNNKHLKHALQDTLQHKPLHEISAAVDALSIGTPQPLNAQKQHTLDSYAQAQLSMKLTFQNEKKALSDPATKRKCIMMDYFFTNYYFDLLTYRFQRNQRLEAFKRDAAARKLQGPEFAKEWKHYCGKERANLRRRRARTKEEQFQILTKVFLARKKDTKEICALKRMNKRLVEKLNETQHILTERDILTAADSPWLVKLLYAFQDSKHVYLAMEFVPGGDMRTLLNNGGVLREEHARFYLAEMLSAVDALHRMGYIHRDLKPENFLIDGFGHVKLTDFGLSKGFLSTQRLESIKKRLDALKDRQVIQMTCNERRTIYRTIKGDDLSRGYSLVGSPEYMAPEVMRCNQDSNNGYDFLVDYWSLGCIFFEMLSGYAPFTAATSDEVWVNVLHWKRVLERPVYEGRDAEFNLSDEAWDAVTNLIADRERRISSISKFQSHPLFAKRPKIRWHRLREDTIPPFVPELDSAIDCTYFDDFDDPRNHQIYKEVYEKRDAVERCIGGLADGPSNRASFVGFTFKRQDHRPWESAAFI